MRSLRAKSLRQKPYRLKNLRLKRLLLKKHRAMLLSPKIHRQSLPSLQKVRQKSRHLLIHLPQTQKNLRRQNILSLRIYCSGRRIYRNYRDY